MGLTSSQEDANQNVEATTVEETSTPTSPSGRQQLRISQGTNCRSLGFQKKKKKKKTFSAITITDTNITSFCTNRRCSS